MLVCLDVDYRRNDTARAAAIFFADWGSDEASEVRVVSVAAVQPYQPGQFYVRELPCLLAVLEGHLDGLQAIVIDGYVTLDRAGRPGLGQHLFEALGGRIPVIGVAKTAFQGSPHAVPVQRGGAQTPLYVTAAGIGLQSAADHIWQMHGPHRLPTLLKRVDCLCREAQ